MKRELIDRLSDITNEEMSVLSDSYSLSSDAEPAFANMALRRRDYIWNVIGTRQTVTVKPHTRFVEIPVHSHSYVEMMYVCDGSITPFHRRADAHSPQRGAAAHEPARKALCFSLRQTRHRDEFSHLQRFHAAGGREVPQLPAAVGFCGKQSLRHGKIALARFPCGRKFRD